MYVIQAIEDKPDPDTGASSAATNTLPGADSVIKLGPNKWGDLAHFEVLLVLEVLELSSATTDFCNYRFLQL